MDGDTPHAVSGPYDWAEFDRRLRELVSEFAPVRGTVHEDEDGDSLIDPEEGLVPPFVATDFLLIVAYEDSEGTTATGHFTPQDAVRYRMLGLLSRLDEVI